MSEEVRTLTRLLSVRQFAAAHPAFTESALRSLIFDADQHGLEPAIIRIGRKVVIDESKFLELARQPRAGG